MVCKPKSLNELISGISNVKLVGVGNPIIYGITHNSKEVKKGYIFCCIKGEKLNGNNFVNEAIRNGAVAILSEYTSEINIPIIHSSDTRQTMGLLTSRLYDDPCSKLTLFGITGTKGKTTIAYLLYQALGYSDGNACLSSTIGKIFKNDYNYSLRTTPESTELLPFIAFAQENGCKYAIIELSSHALVQNRASGIKIDIGCFTNLYPEHLEYHRDIEHYYRAKSNILYLIKDGGKMIINTDTDWGKRLFKISSKLPHIDTISVSSDKFSDIHLEIKKINSNKDLIKIKSKNYNIVVDSHFKCDFNAYNLAMTIILLLEVGFEHQFVIDNIKNTKLPPGRMEEIDLGQTYKVIIDYAHTPESIEMLLHQLRYECGNGRIITVFGATGDRYKEKRPIFGKIISELSDKFIITTDDPYNENPSDIANDIIFGIDKNNLMSVETILDRGSAIERALSLASKGDIVIIAGKGHEKYIIYSDKRIPFNDRDFTEDALRRLLKKEKN
ncbi:MAG: UDP-N-acetylmuramoyl-L-alanyl-D-glutamate--2,6-diaminopimelate ligase [bacterium]